jgi:selenocysteine-specific elongation factor
MVESGAGAAHWGIAPAHWQALLAALEQALDCWHRERPERLGASAEALARLLPSATSASLTTAALLELLRQGKAARRGAVFHRPGHRASLPPADDDLWRRVEPALARGGLRPDTLGELAERLDMTVAETEAFLVRAASFGLAVRVARNRYFLPQSLRELAGIGEALAAEGRFTAAAFRDRSGVGRNLAIELLEFFDRARFTLREGDHRRILLPAASIFGPAGRE